MTKLYISSPEHFHLITESFHTLINILLLPSPVPIEHQYTSGSMCSFLGCTQKWDHITFVFFILLSIMPSRLIHVVTNSRILSFLWLNYTALFIYITCPFPLISWWTQVVCVLSIVNKFFKILISFPLHMCPVVGLPDHVVVLFFIVWRPPVHFKSESTFK